MEEIGEFCSTCHGESTVENEIEREIRFEEVIDPFVCNNKGCKFSISHEDDMDVMQAHLKNCQHQVIAGGQSYESIISSL